MFNLQQKYKKTFHKMQNQETSSLETPLRYQGRNRREPQGAGGCCGRVTQKEQAGSAWVGGLCSQAYSPWPLCPLPQCSIWSRQTGDLLLMASSPPLCRLKVVLCQGLKTGFLVFKVTTFLFLQIQNILARFNYKH